MRSTLILAISLVTTPAWAHIHLTYPPARTTDQKQGPCGLTGMTRGSNVTTLAPGATIEVTWDETVNHPGHYRISFDVDGEDDFVVPATVDDFYAAESVLEDEIPDTGGPYIQTITLPDIECTNCTLQLIQLMTDKAPYGDGNDLYYQCADITLGAGGPPADEPEDPPPQAMGGCQAATSTGAWPVALVLLLGFVRVLTRRRASAR